MSSLTSGSHLPGGNRLSRLIMLAGLALNPTMNPVLRLMVHMLAALLGGYIVAAAGSRLLLA